MFADEDRKISRATLGVLVGLIVFSGIAVLGITIYQKQVSDEVALDPQLFKGPMLEQGEGEVLARVRAAEDKLLGEYAWTNRNLGLARVPIEVAMQAVVAGAPTSTTTDAQKGGTK